jgi:hypothetical protein
MAGEGVIAPPRFSLGARAMRLGAGMTSFNWGHYSPGSDNAFPTPFLMESIVVIVLSPFLTAAFGLFAIFLGAAGFHFGLSLKPTTTLASPLTVTSMLPSALIN